MASASYDLGLVSTLNADAIGMPGRRRFRLLAEGPGGSALFWLEKEQLQELAMVIYRVLATRAAGEESAPAESPALTAPPQNLDFRAGRVALEYDERGRVFWIEAGEWDAGQDTPPLVGLWATREQMEGLAEEALQVCAAGRPLCPLCHVSVDEDVQHTCPVANGHGAA